jgi:hypothetical protein
VEKFVEMKGRNKKEVVYEYICYYRWRKGEEMTQVLRP